MMYGNVINRLSEGKQYGDIKVGTDITMYLWSDRNCYYVTDVIDDKHIKVREYIVIADHDEACGMGHQNWLYFKTGEDANKYLSSRFDTLRMIDYETPQEETWAFRYGKWWRDYEYTEEKDWFSDKERAKIQNGKTVHEYSELSGKVSFGVRDYYYDWEF